MKFQGSRNYTEEQVSDLIWESPPGTKIEVEILEDGNVSVKYTPGIRIPYPPPQIECL